MNSRANEFDVVVVGAGASGAAATWRLATLGISVLCLEQGDWVNPATSPSCADDWEIHRQKQWHPSPEQRNAATDYPVDATHSAIRPWFFNAVGGSTVLWSCHIPRFHATDFTMFSDDGVGDDWPIRLGDLQAYYSINENMMGVAGLAGYPDYHDGGEDKCQVKRTPPASIGKHGRLMAAAFERLGWSWWPADLAIRTGNPEASQAAMKHSCNNCGPCELHCPRTAKASVDTRYWPLALAAGAQLRTGARVFGIETDKRGSAIQAVRYWDRSGVAHTVTTKNLMLGANGLGTPRLLMLAAGGQHPNGLANRSGLLGKRLMMHPLARVTGQFAEATESYRGITAGALVSHHFYASDHSRGFRRGFKLQMLGSAGPALVALGSLGQPMPWGDKHHEYFTQWFNHSISLSICCDDLPENSNRVELDSNRSDSDGLPGVRVFYKTGENSRHSLNFGIDKAKQVMLEAGAFNTIIMSSVPDSGFHLMGTCRMGHDPENSVLNPWCESHDVKGLFVIDSSAFVTAAAVNPTNTLQALALRAADHLYHTRRIR